MRRRLGIGTLFVSLVSLATSSNILGGPSGPAIYVSLIDQHQIGAVDASTGGVSIVYAGGDDFHPESLVVGPDEKLYVADPRADRIWRVDPGDGDAHIVYEASGGGDPRRPRGLSFGPGDTLYFTADEDAGSGVWQLPAVAAGRAAARRVSPIPVASGSENRSGSARGTAWSPEGNLLVADALRHEIAISNPSLDTTAGRVIATIDAPYGIAANSRGEIFTIPAGGELIRKRAADGSRAVEWVRLTPGDQASALETDALDNVWVTTRHPETGTGKLLRVAASGSLIEIATFGASAASGIAVPATAASITRSFEPGEERQAFDFGDTKLVLAPHGVAPAEITVTAIEMPPGRVATRLEAFFPQAQCVRYGSRGGNCVVYRVKNSGFSGRGDLRIELFSNEINTPAILNDPSQFPGDFFAEDVFEALLPASASEAEPTRHVMRAAAAGFWEFVVVEMNPVASASAGTLSSDSPTGSTPSIGTPPATTHPAATTDAGTTEAANEAGGATGSSAAGPGPSFDIWYGTHQTFGLAGQSQLDANLLGNVSDPDGVSSLFYSLNGGPERQLSIGMNSNRLAGTGDFNADIAFAELLNGANTVTLRAVDDGGNQSTQIVTLTYVNSYTPSMSHTVDWSTATDISDVAQVVDGKWALSADGVSVVELGYDRLIALGDVSWDNYEVTVPVTVHEIKTPTSPGPGVGIGVRWGNHGEFSPGEQPPAKWFFSTGSIALWRTLLDGEETVWMWGSDGSVVAEQARPFELHEEYTLKMRAQTLAGVGHQYSFKMWRSTQPEPAGWDIVNTEPSGQQTNGSVLLVAHHADATFGDVVVTPCATSPDCDPAPPAAPTGLVATGIGATQIDLSWTDNSNDETSFQLKRSVEGGAWVTAAELAPNTTFSSRNGLLPGTDYCFRVKAKNSVGSSANSNTDCATTLLVDPAPPLAPSNLTTTAPGATQVDLSWTDNSNNESSFQVKEKIDGGDWVTATVLGPNTTFFSRHGLLPGTEYCYRLKAKNTAGSSANSSSDCATTLLVDPAPPDGPSALSAAPAGATQIDISWSDNSNNETSFQLKEKIDGGDWITAAVLNPNTTSFSRHGLIPGTEYCYRVKAKNTAGSSPNSASACATTWLNDPAPPITPGNLTVGGPGATQIDLSWTDRSGNETSFEIKEKVSGGVWVTVASLAPDTTFFSRYGLTPGTEYCYRVKAKNTAGSSPNSNTGCATTLLVDPAPPTAPSNTVAVGSGATQVDLQWTDNSNNETSFEIKEKVGGGAWVTVASLDPNTVSLSRYQLWPATEYCYRIKAKNTAGSSLNSNSHCTTTLSVDPAPPATPGNLSATGAGATRINLSWADASGNETSFEIKERVAGGAWITTASVGPNTTTFSRTGLLSGIEYCYRVKAKNTAGSSPNSNTDCATTAASSNTATAAPTRMRIKPAAPFDLAHWNGDRSDPPRPLPTRRRIR